MEAPGEEFLQQRLCRAQHLPPSERSGDVAAFVESEALLAEVREALPLTADCEAALPPSTPGLLERVLLAILKVVRADYICPSELPREKEALLRLGAYTGGPASVIDAAVGGTGPLAYLSGLLGGYSLIVYYLSRGDVEDLKVESTLATSLSNLQANQQLCSQRQRLLQHVAPAEHGKLATIAQLHFSLCWHIVNCAINVSVLPLQQQHAAAWAAPDGSAAGCCCQQ